MKFIALVLALALEQAWPLRRNNRLYAAFDRYADFLERQFNGLQASHGAIAWLVAVLPLALLTLIVEALMRELNVFLAIAWSVGVLYVAMGFRRFSHCFTDIAQALREQNVNNARDVLGRWRGVPADELNAAEVARVSIELGLLQAHRYVLGPIFWFVIIGPVGPVIYRAADLLAESWGKQVEPEKRIFALFAERAFFWIDWLPARVTAKMPPIAGAHRLRHGTAMPKAWCWPVARVRWASSWAEPCARTAC
jgi:adenosylcobinamide-phosphate synthase